MPGDFLDAVSMLHSQAALIRDRPAGSRWWVYAAKIGEGSPTRASVKRKPHVSKAIVGELSLQSGCGNLRNDIDCSGVMTLGRS